MNINIKTKFNVGDKVLTRLKEEVTIRTIQVEVSATKLKSLNYINITYYVDGKDFSYKPFNERDLSIDGNF